MNQSYKYLFLKYSDTKIGQNVDGLLKFKKIYYHLMENEMPILKGGERRKKGRKVEQGKNVILLAAGAFFCFNRRIGIINRALLCMFTTQALVFMTKCNFYKQCIDEINFEMTLTGQESRLLTNYYFEHHKDKSMFLELCQKYKDLSKALKEKENYRLNVLSKSMNQQKQLDQEFADRLKSFDSVDDE